MMPFYIGIAGQKGMGKDSLASAMLARLPQHSLAHFADRLYETLAQLTGFPVDYLRRFKNAPFHPPGWSCTIREALTTLGPALNAIDPLAWTRLVIPSPVPVVIADVRHETEMRSIGRGHGRIVLCYRPGFLTDNPHPSEKFVGDLIREFLDHGVRSGPVRHILIDEFWVNDGSQDDIGPASAAILAGWKGDPDGSV